MCHDLWLNTKCYSKDLFLYLFFRGATTVVEYLCGKQLQQPEFKDKMFHSNRLVGVIPLFADRGRHSLNRGNRGFFYTAFTFILTKYPSSDSVTL